MPLVLPHDSEIFAILFFSCDFFFLVHYIDHQFWRQQKPESSLLWIAAPRVVLSVGFLLYCSYNQKGFYALCVH